MGQAFIENKTFDKINFGITAPERGEYENCKFINCDLSNCDLSEIKFLDCSFTDCNLSLAKLAKTSFQGIKFRNCKMLGLRFDHCTGFNLAISFEDCILNHCCFYGVKIKKTIFRNTQLQEADFTGCDLTASIIEKCDLTRAVFENTILEKADLRGSYNYMIDPEINKITKAKFSLAEVAGLLTRHNIEIDNAN